jgi:hypothetical protein
MQLFYQWRGFFHDWKHTMDIALAAADVERRCAASGPARPR